MIEIEFDYEQKKTIIQGNSKDKFQVIIDKYIEKSLLNPEYASFFVNGNKIVPEKTIEEQMNQLNKKDNKMKVLVNLINEKNKEEVLIQSKDIICPKCNEPCKIKIENYKIKLYDCINNHIVENIKILDFQNTQKVNISNIICDICKVDNKSNSYNQEFYKCLTCGKNLCILCKTKHELEHNIIAYEQKNYICKKHNDFFAEYCKNCKQNLCFMCKMEHIEHNTIYFGDLMQEINKLSNNTSEIKIIIESLNQEIKDIIKKLSELTKILNIYNDIQNNILKNFNLRNRNYYILENIKEISTNNDIIEKLKNINKIKNLSNKIFNMINFYQLINSGNEEMIIEDSIKNEKSENITDRYNIPELNDNSNIIINNKNEEYIESNSDNNENNNNSSQNLYNKMKIIYNIKKDMEKIKLFDDVFVNNNKNNFIFINRWKAKRIMFRINIK